MRHQRDSTGKGYREQSATDNGQGDFFHHVRALFGVHVYVPTAARIATTKPIASAT